MTFPVYFNLFGHPLHAHLAMELIAYTAGSQLYFFLRRRAKQDRLPIETNLWLIVGAIFGALFGSKILAWVESLPDYLAHGDALAMFFQGKTIVGGLLGGWIGVEIAKKCLGVARSTGDLFVFPLIVGMCIGRVGCFLTGVEDHTCGRHTSVPWAVDFGDGPRHPSQLYEIAFLLLLGAGLLLLRSRKPLPQGRLFRLFMAGYLTFRFFVEFIHWPRYNPYLGLSAIQLACLAGVVVIAVRERFRQPNKPADDFEHSLPVSPT